MAFDMTTGPASRPVAELTLRAAFRGGAQILGPLNLTIHTGETVAVQGPSGVGKTTLLRVLAGLDLGFEGARSVTDRTATMFQEPTLLPWRTARDNIVIATGCAPATAEALLGEVGLGDRVAAFPGQLSLGQQRRLALARAFAISPDLLLLDEPFVSLDAALVQEMLLLFDRLRRQRRLAAVVVTHSEAEARALATRIVSLGGNPAAITSERENRPTLAP